VDLARQIAALAADPARAAELGRRGAAGVRAHYSADRMAERAAEVFQGVIDRASRSTHAVA
jgi:hypothetical protein